MQSAYVSFTIVAGTSFGGKPCGGGAAMPNGPVSLSGCASTLIDPCVRIHMGAPYRHTRSGRVAGCVVAFASRDVRLAPNTSTRVPPSAGPEVGEMPYSAGGS